MIFSGLFGMGHTQKSSETTPGSTIQNQFFWISGDSDSGSQHLEDLKLISEICAFYLFIYLEICTF